MDDLLVISGPPGSGKSTVAELIADARPSVLVEGDAFFRFLRGGTDPWLPEADHQNELVIAAAGAVAGRFAAGGMATVFDGVLGPWHLPQFIAATGLAAIDYAVLLPPLPVVLGRVAGRQDHAFHDRDAAQHMHDEFASSGIDERHRFSASAAPDAVADAILAARALGGLQVPA